MKNQKNKQIRIDSYNTIINYSAEKKIITVNRLSTNNDNNRTIINLRRRNIFERNENKPFIYKKKSKLERANSFYIKNKENISLRNENNFLKEAKPLLLIPSYKYINIKKNYNNIENKKKIKTKKKLEIKYNINLSRNNKNEHERYSHNNYNNKYYSFYERYKTKTNNKKSKNKNKGISSNSTGISYGDTNKNIQKYNCYSFDDDMMIKGDQNNNINSNNDDLNEDKSIITLWNLSNNDNDSNNTKYIKTLEKQNEFLKQELVKTNNKLYLLESKIDSLIKGKLFKGIHQLKDKEIKRIKTPTYKKNNLIKKCPIPTPYVQKYSKNDFFNSKKRNIKVTLKKNIKFN